MNVIETFYLNIFLLFLDLYLSTTCNNANLLSVWLQQHNTGRVKNKRFYKIPDPKKERQRAVRWLHNMGNSKFSVSNFISSRNKVLCEDHFHINCIKRDLEFEMMGSSSGFPNLCIYRTTRKICHFGKV